MLGFLYRNDRIPKRAVLLGRFQSKSGVRNITAIVSAFGISGVPGAWGDRRVNRHFPICRPPNALLIMLGVLHLVGSICLLMPIQRIRVLAGISDVCREPLDIGSVCNWRRCVK